MRFGNLFDRSGKVVGRAGRRAGTRSRRERLRDRESASVGFQTLEDRLAMAVNVVTMPLTSGTSSLTSPAFAYDIVINDNPNTFDAISNPFGSGFGTGQDAYIRGGTGGFLLADNSSFLNALPLTTASVTRNFGSGTSTSIGPPSTILVSTGDYQSSLSAVLNSVTGTATAGGSTLTNLNVLKAQRTFTIGQTLESANITGGSSTITAINSDTSITIAGTFIAAGSTNLELGLPTTAAQPFRAASGMTAVATTAGSTTITMASTVQLTVGMLVTGSGMAGGTYITAIDPNGTDATISQAATLTDTAAYLKFSAGMDGTQLFHVGTGQYRFYLPISYPHAVSGSVSSSATTGRFDFGAFGLSPSGGVNLGLQAVSQPSPTAYAAPVSGGSLNTMTTGYDASRNATFITLSFFSSATGNARLDVNNLTIALDPYVASRVTNEKPQSVTIAAGQTINQRFMVDFAVTNSTVNINSPLVSQADANNPGFIDSYWPIDLTATNINVNQDTTSVGIFSIGRFNRHLGVSSPIYGPEFLRANVAGYGPAAAPPVSSVNINATVSATSYQIQVDGQTPTPGTSSPHGSFTVSQQGSLVGSGGGTTSAADITFNALYADLRYLGDVRAVTQNYLITANGSADQYDFTTRDSVTGNQSGLVVADTMVMTLSAPQGGTVDLSTAINTLRFDSGSSNDIPYNYDVLVSDTGDLVVDAVAASTGSISLQAGGNMTVKGAAVQTAGDITLQAGGTLSIAGNIATSDGVASLIAPSLSLGGTLTSGGVRGASLLTTTGGVSAAALVRAGGTVKKSVRLGSEKAYTLSTLVTGASFGGGTLATGDRILLKNQAVPSENGLYVVQAAASPVRATDANTSAAFLTGMNVMVREGSQEGEWTFQNVSSTNLGVSSLQFVASTATRVYGPVAAYSASDIDLVTGGLLTIDGVALAAGDRVLVNGQSNPVDNGIYVASAGAWSRASDADAANQLEAGGYVLVQGGLAYANQAFALANDVLTVGVTPMSFSAFTVQSTRTNTWSPIAVLDDAAVATTVNISLSGLQTIDGVAVTAGQRVLVKNQIDATQNGVYVVSGGAWTRAADALSASAFARGTSVYVLSGTQNGSTAWQFDDSTRMRGTTAANSPVVTGLITNAVLEVGMLVTAPGIPAGTTIQSLGTDGTSIRLSANAILAGTVAISFTKVTTATVDTTPLPFIPAGGSLDVTSATTIGGAGRLQGATALLTAGTSGAASTSTINVLTNVGRVSAIAPGAITLDNSTAMEIDLARTTTDGAIKATAAGTLTALSVSAASAGVTAQPVTLTSTYGDVVAESVTATKGDITAVSKNGGIAFTKARRNASNISAIAGSISATADAATAVITVDGRLLAQGTGADVVLASNLGGVAFTKNAIVTAADQLKITTPNSTPTVAAGAAITAARLSLTSQFGADPAALLTSLGTYQVVDLNRTDSGPVTFTSPSSLTVEGATTANGSISLSAPDITVTGPIASQGTSTDVTLTASAGNLVINSPITSLQDIKLSAAAGEIGGSLTQTAAGTFSAGSAVIRNLASTATLAVGMRVTGAGIPAAGPGLPAGACIVSIDSATQVTLSAPATAAGTGATLTFTSPTALLTAPRNVSATASSAARLSAKAAALTGTTITAGGGFLGVTDVDGLDLTLATLTAGGTAAFNVGSAAVGGATNVGFVDAGIAGAVVLTSYGNVNSITPDTNADIRAASATLLTTAGKIRLDTDVDTLSAIASQKNQSITINDVGSLQLLSVGSGSAGIGVDVDVTAAGTLTATNVLTSGKVTLKTTGAAADILVDSITAAGNVVTLQAGNSIREVTPGDVSADVTATSVSLTAANGDIDLYLATSAATAVASTAGKSVTLKNDAALALGASSATTMTLNVGGVVSQTAALTAGTLVINAFNGSDITLGQANQVGTFAASSVSGATRGNILINDTSGDLALGTATNGITANQLKITAVGNVSQTQPYALQNAIDAVAVNISTSAGGLISLDNPNNKIGGLTLSNGGVITLTSNAGLAITGLNGTVITIIANGDVTQLPGPGNAIIATTSLTVTDTAGSVTLDNPANNTPSLAISNPGRNVTYKNAGALDIAAAGIQGGAIALTTIGGLTDTGALTGTSLEVTNTVSGNVVLDNANNSVGSLAVANSLGAVTYVNKAALDVAAAGIQGTAVAISTVGGLSDTGSITGSSLAVTNTGSGNVVLDSANSVSSLSVANAVGNVTYATTSAGAVDIAAAGLAGKQVVLTAPGAITQTGAITASTSLTVTSSTGEAITLANAGNTVAAFSATSSAAGTRGAVVFTNPNSGLTINGVTAGPVTITTRDGLVISQAVTAGDPVAPGAAGDGDISLTSQLGSITVNNTLTAYQDTITLNAVNGGITFNPTYQQNCAVLNYTYDPSFPAPAPNAPGAVINVTINGDLTLTNPGSAIGSYTVTGNIFVTSNTAITVNGLLKTIGTGKTVSLLSTGGTITFGPGGGISNDAVTGITQLSAVAGTISGLAGTTISGGSTSIIVGQALSLPATIVAASLSATSANPVALSLTGSNAIGAFTGASGAGASRGDITINDTTSGLSIGAVTAGTFTITGVGAISQSGVIDATTLDVTGNGSPISLDTQNNLVGTFKAANATGGISLKDTAGGLILGSVTGGQVAITTGGSIGAAPITQAVGAVITAGSLAVTGNGLVTSPITLTNANDLGAFAATGGLAAVAVNDTVGGLDLGTTTSSKLTVTAAGLVTLPQSQVKASGDVAITTPGNLSVIGPQPGGLLQSATKINLSGVAGTISLVNGGKISAPVVIGNGKAIQVGGIATTGAELSQSLTTVNGLSPIAGSTYEILIGANIALTSALPVVIRPITLRGNNDVAYTISNGGGVTTGLSLAATSSGSTIRNLAFSGFSANGVLVSGGTAAAPNKVTIANLAIRSSGTTGAGLNFAGAGTSTYFTGSTVQNCTFTSDPYAMRLTSAYGVTIGGLAAGQNNTVTGSTKAGVFASGYCTNSSVIKTVFATTPVPYNTATSRNLKIVK